MVDFMHCLRNLLFFGIALLYCYIVILIFNNLLSLFWRYVSIFGAANSSLDLLLCNQLEEFSKTVAILSTILLPFKSPNDSAVLDCSFGLHLLLTFLH